MADGPWADNVDDGPRRNSIEVGNYSRQQRGSPVSRGASRCWVYYYLPFAVKISGFGKGVDCITQMRFANQGSILIEGNGFPLGMPRGSPIYLWNFC